MEESAVQSHAGFLPLRTEDLPAQDTCPEPRVLGEAVTTHEDWRLAVLTCLLGAGLDCLRSWL